VPPTNRARASGRLRVVAFAASLTFAASATSAASAVAQETLRVSVDSAGAEGNSQSGFFGTTAISADGRVVAFESDATNLVANDTNGVGDLFVHDLASGATERVDVDSAGAEADQMSLMPALSADGQVVAFESLATNLVANDGNGKWDVFVRDRSAGTTERISVDSSGAEAGDASFSPALSADGMVISFVSWAGNLVAGDTNGHSDIFVHDRSTGMTERVSVDSSGAEGDGNSGLIGHPALSADGRFVAFSSASTNLVAGDTNQAEDIFVHDRGTGVTERVSVKSSGAQANDRCYSPAISADGRFVAFETVATNLVAHDTNGASDVFVRDRTNGTTERVSVDSAGAEGNGHSVSASLSADGRFAAFASDATNLVAGDANGWTDVFRRDRSSGITERLSVGSSGAEGNDGSYLPALAADGWNAVFSSFATNFVAGDANGVIDVFVREFCATPASWSNYGAGFPGTNGVPTFTSRQNPAFGATVTLDLANSYAQPTVGVLFVGFQQTSLHSNWGGDLLVVPALTLFTTFSYGANSYTGDVPDDDALCGVTVDLQAIEADPGAAKGVSFTPGLELVIGR
jgi:Tol biopolymer transport system component